MKRLYHHEFERLVAEGGKRRLTDEEVVILIAHMMALWGYGAMTVNRLVDNLPLGRVRIKRLVAASDLLRLGQSTLRTHKHRGDRLYYTTSFKWEN